MRIIKHFLRAFIESRHFFMLQEAASLSFYTPSASLCSPASLPIHSSPFGSLRDNQTLAIPILLLRLLSCHVD